MVVSPMISTCSLLCSSSGQANMDCINEDGHIFCHPASVESGKWSSFRTAQKLFNSGTLPP
ncbi:hypothetical protein AB6A40_003027 [Gnathostoma spinigerum]|uniref:Uncharacterized protein n=1 Tax=Gnathostoma spinigerum TaxID=75299 RepID=A0ABD6EH83_9BILA